MAALTLVKKESQHELAADEDCAERGIHRENSAEEQQAAAADSAGEVGLAGTVEQQSGGSDHESLSDDRPLTKSHHRNIASDAAKAKEKKTTKADRIRECIQPLHESLGEESKRKISSILNEVESLSDIEKLLLYLQLPTGAQPDVDPLKQKSPGNPLGKKADAEIAQTYTWIQSHLEEDPEVSLPKQEVYEEYRLFCEANTIEPLCAADFGKVMKHIFPKVKPRRLGTRGNSRYCYSGLRKKLEVDPPMLPELDVSNDEMSGTKGAKEDEVASAACHLIMEWAEKLFGKKFATVKDLAGHLIANMYVDNRSVAGFTILSSLGEQNPEKAGNQATAILKQTSGNRRRETQIHLQRKLHEKELIKEQRKKLVEQQAQVFRINSPKSSSRKSHSCKKGPDQQQQQNHISNGHENDTNPDKISSQLSTVVSATTSKESTITLDVTKGAVKFEDGWTKAMTVENFLKQEDEGGEKVPVMTKSAKDEKQELAKKFSKVPIPRNSSGTSPKVCLSQAAAVSSIIIVPSAPQVRFPDLGSTKTTQQRYKRIQPKPVSSRSMRSSDTSSVFTCRDKSDQGDATIQLDVSEKSLPIQLDQMENLPSFQKEAASEFGSHFPVTLNADLVLSPTTDSNSQFRCGNGLESDPASGTNTSDPEELPPSNLLSQLENSLSGSSDVVKMPQSVELPSLMDSSVKTEQDCSSLLLNSDVMFPDGASHSTKRHSEERDAENVISKKPHLESLMKSPTKTTTLPSFSKAGLQKIPLLLGAEQRKGTKQEEMSIQQLESDALMEYLHGSNMETALENADAAERQVIAGDAVLSNLENSPLSDQLISGNQTTQLSQLRMLLERNLPQRNLTFIKKEQSDVCQIVSPSSINQISNDEIGIILNAQQSSQELGELRQVLLRDNRLAGLPKATALQSPNAQKSLKQSGGTQLEAVASLSELDVLQQQGSELQSQINAIMAERGTDFQGFEGSNVDSAEAGSLGVKAGHTLQVSGMPTLLGLDQQPSNELVKINCYTQFPSVPPSPNTRCRAFNFTPISPRQTPVQECLTQSTMTCSSPTQSQASHMLNSMTANMVSVAVGPSQPPSAASSPFVSPRSTPVPLSRSRHNSGQSAYSTPRHTPFQNFDSGVSSVSTSPFISPQSTPVPVSRLRHNSSHSQGRTVTFNTSQSIQTHGTMHSSRSRHSSGPGGPHQVCHLTSPRSAPMSPMVSESLLANAFTFPTVGDTPPIRSRHNSASSTTPHSPTSAPMSPSAAVGAHPQDGTLTSGILTSDELSNQMIRQGLDSEANPTKLWLNSDLLSTSGLDQKLSSQVNWQSTLKNNPLWPGSRQRHFSGSVIHHKTSVDSVSPEIQALLKNAPGMVASTTTRSRSVPLRQMLQNFPDQYGTSSSLLEDGFSKSYPATPNTSSTFQFPSSSSQSGGPSEENMEMSPNDFTSDVDLHQAAPDNQDILVQSSGDAEWMLSPSEDSLRRNIDLLEHPLEDDLQRAYDDLRACEPEFSQFTQGLEEHSVESWNLK